MNDRFLREGKATEDLEISDGLPDREPQSSVSTERRRADRGRGRRMDDELRLRELELQTNFQIKTLTESLNLLKNDFHSWRESLNDKMSKVDREVDQLKTRITIVIVLLVGQLALPTGFLTKFIGF